MVTFKTYLMKNSIFILAILTLFLVPQSCNKENPQPTSAQFTTNLQGNTVTAGTRITIYLSNATGEFLTYFRGDSEDNTFGTGYGTVLEAGTDSLSLAYFDEGDFTFSLVATSYGNWGKDVSQDVQSLNLSVVAATE